VARVTLTSILGPVAKFTIACSGIAGQVCTGNSVATTVLREAGGTILAVSASAKPRSHRHHRRPRTVTATVARAAYSVPAGTRATVRLTLNSVGRRVLSRFLAVPTLVTFFGSFAGALPVTFAYPRVAATIHDQWTWGCTPSGVCRTHVQGLRVTGLPRGARVTVLCQGGGCSFRTHVFKPHRTSLALTALFAGAKLRPGTTVTVEVTVHQQVGEVVIFTVQTRSIPRSKTLCLEPGAGKAQACT
jgi:hypothetical protein